MSDERTAMNEALRAEFVPTLRAAGFRGSLPHFRRIGPEKTDLLTVQYSKWGGQFVLELAEAPPGEVVTPWGKRIPATRLTAYDAALTERCRLGPLPAAAGDSWFGFGGDSLDRFGVAARAAAAALSQAFAYWDGQRAQPNVRRFAREHEHHTPAT